MEPIQSRRRFLQRLTLGAAFFSTPGLFAEALTDRARLIETPRMTEGPFYPDRIPLDTDNDLLIINDAITPAVGEITYLSGRVLTASGQPVRNAFVEIWQCDSNASYIHTHGRNPNGSFDRNFQGYGRFLTDSKGQYFFRTIKPVPYTLQGQLRAPHIHFAISRNGQRICTTQMMIRGHDMNARDDILSGLRNTRARETALVDFKPVGGSKIGEFTANFDIVCGITAQEDEAGKLRGGSAADL
jgi:protocatechuate 3,4-dioxygenase, beta subunit